MRVEDSGTGFVAEITHFLAHPETRTQGIVRRELCDMFAFLKFRETFHRSKVITRDLPATVPDALRANLRRMRESVLKMKTGKKRPEAKRILEHILSRMTPTVGGGISKANIWNREEYNVLQCVFSDIKGGSFFTDENLFDDFCRGLHAQLILRGNERKALKKSKAAISLFALVAMHNRTVDLDDGTIAKLAIASDIKRRLGIFAFAEIVKDYGFGPVIGGAWIFETALAIDDYCEPGVASLERSAFIGDLEINPRGKLARVN